MNTLLKNAARTRAKTVELTTYYETGSVRRGTIKTHRTTHNSKAAAIKQACELSQKTGHFVTVMKKGLEVAACHEGKKVSR